MKKLGLLVIPVMAVSLLASCVHGPEPTPTTKYTLNFILDDCNVGGETTYSKTYDKGATIEPVTVSPVDSFVLTDDSVETRYQQYWSEATGGNYTFSNLTMNTNYTIVIAATPTYTITFKNEGDEDKKIDNIKAGSIITDNIPTPSPREGYDFIGWCTNAGGECVFDFSKIKIYQDYTLYSGWKESRATAYTVTWFDWDGTKLKVDLNVKDGTVPVYEDPTHPTPTRESDIYIYNFKSWLPIPKEIHCDTVYIATYDKTLNAQFCSNIDMKEDNQTFKFSDISADEFIIDWGDDSGLSQELSHQYTSKGKYDIKVGAKSLSDFKIDDTSKAFIQTAHLGTGVREISDGAFNGCSNLTSIDLPDSIIAIGSKAFKECSQLASIKLPNNPSLTSINNDTFRGCSNLASVIFPSKLSSIGENTFRGCAKLDVVNIPDTVTSIGEYAFAGCHSLTSIIIPDGVESISQFTFQHCFNLVNITLPSALVSIEEDAFYECTSLATINLPNTVTSISRGAFFGCSSLTTINIPNSLRSIDGQVFSNCTSLATISIPNTVTSIGDLTFHKCGSLEKVDLTTYTTSSTIPTCNSDSFYECSTKLKFHVASEEMANKFKDSGKGWPNILDKYHWPGKPEKI